MTARNETEQRDCGDCSPVCSIAELQALLQYDPLRGRFKWLVLTNRRAKGWFRGNKSVRNYRRLYIKGRHVLAHVAAWALMTGAWPTHEIDHKDRNQGNNRWSNLRAATHAQNGRNRTRGTNNTTGVLGVSRFGQRFRATIRVRGKVLSLGLHNTVAGAAAARKKAEEKYFGEFAPTP